MKTKDFREILEKRFSKEEIKKIEQEAFEEAEALRAKQGKKNLTRAYN